MEPEGSLPNSHVPATSPYPEPARSSPCPHTPLPEERYNSTLSLTSALDWRWVVNATPRPLYPLQKDPVPIVSPSAGLDRLCRISPPLGFEPRTAQPVVSRCVRTAVCRVTVPTSAITQLAPVLPLLTPVSIGVMLGGNSF